MHPGITVKVSAADRRQLVAIAADRNCPQMHVWPSPDRVVAHGGSIDGPGAVVVHGTLYVSSGCSIFGGLPGNVLLAYSVDGR